MSVSINTINILLYWREYKYEFMVLHRVNSRLLVSIQMSFSISIKITTLHYFLHRQITAPSNYENSQYF